MTDEYALHKALKSVDASCPDSSEFVALLRGLKRDSRKAAAQARAQLNFEWADEPAYQRQIEQTQARLSQAEIDLMRMWPGARLERDGDPRGFVVRLVPPNRRGTSFAGGVGVA